MAARPKVLLVTPDFPPEGGGIQLLLERVIQHAPGLDVRVLTFGHPDAAGFDPGSGLDVRRVSSVESNRQLAALGLNASSLLEAARFRPDVIVSGHAIASLGAIVLRRLLRVPFVQYVHADELRVRASITGAAVRTADATIAVSRYTRDIVLEAGADSDRVRVIHPGVDLPEDRVVEPAEVPTLLTVASLLFRYKSHDMMVRAMPLIRARVPGAVWVVIGDGVFRPAVESAVRAYGLEECVQFLGRVSDEERNAWLDRAHVFAMPSRIPAAGLGGEGFGIVYMEAAAHGLPSVGGRVAGALDAVVDGETGLLVDPTDYLAIADAATELLEDSPRRERMAVAARRYADEHSWTIIASQVEALLREVADGSFGKS